MNHKVILYLYSALYKVKCPSFQGVKAVKQEFDDVALSRARLYRPPGMLEFSVSDSENVAKMFVLSSIQKKS